MITFAKSVSSPSLSASVTALALAQFRPQPGRIVVPDVCCDLVWARGRLRLTGPLTHAVRSLNEDEDVVLLQLDPLVAYQWLRMPLADLTDRSVDAADIDGRLADEFESTMRRGALARMVEPTDGRRLEDVDGRVVAAVKALRGGARVAAVAAIVGLSERHLERVFADHTGLTPKSFSRIVRFRAALQSAKAGATLADAAAAAGYADQAHFSRDATELAGASPRAILQNVGNVQEVVAAVA